METAVERTPEEKRMAHLRGYCASVPLVYPLGRR